MSPGDAQPEISEYALLSDCHGAALVSREGSVDWLCLPRFDSPATFARLLDATKGGHFLVTVAESRRPARRYLPDTFVLETTFEGPEGTAVLTDFLAVHPHATPEVPHEVVIRERLVRHLRCERGSVRWLMRCLPRFDYGTIVPYVARPSATFGVAHGGAQGLGLYSSVPMEVLDDGFAAEGRLAAGEDAFWVLRDDPRFVPGVQVVTRAQVTRWLEACRRHWTDWASHGSYDGPDRASVMRSALTLKALTYEPSGAMVAAPTTSLPERVGGTLNWDYRYAWIRDASFVLEALYSLGYAQEAGAFLSWLDWTAVGRARDLQLVYGVGGERRLPESTLDALAGWRGSRPVRVGNAAGAQFQLDVYGELVAAVETCQRRALEFHPERWRFLVRVADFVVEHWREPDEGIWETRDGRRHHVHSRVMCWVALDRALRLASSRRLPGDFTRWAATREEIREEVLTRGYRADRGAFVRDYDSDELDAANLVLPLVGFLPATDPRMVATIRATERELCTPEGFVYRNRMHGPVGTEGAFGICTTWLVENLVLLGEVPRARALFDRFVARANDLGLFAEQFEAGTGEARGNFPQALTHLGHVLAALRLRAAEAGPDPAGTAPRAGRGPAAAGR